MYEAARINAVVELVNSFQDTWKTSKPLPTDVIINKYFKQRRYVGSKDRGAIAEIAYFVIRNYSKLDWYANLCKQQSTARIIVIAALLLHYKKKLPDIHNFFNGEKFFPAKLSESEGKAAKQLENQDIINDLMPDHIKYDYPQWLEQQLKDSLGENWQDELLALNKEATVDLRANTLLTTRDELLEKLRAENYEVEPTPFSPIGIRMQTRSPIFTSSYFKQGFFEMQDEGSQLVSLLLDAKSGEKVIDFCAGAGGKTLAIAASMKNKGRILAWDNSAHRLDQMADRLKRARVDNVQKRVIESENDDFLKRHKGSADKVIVDAPCSGSGTWRRNPDLKWHFKAENLANIMDTQERILESAARLVKVGGKLLYITCSILQSENESQVEAFLEKNKNFRVATSDELCFNIPAHAIIREGMFKFTPYRTGTDGFFASLLQRF